MYKKLVAKLNLIFPKKHLQNFFYGPFFPIYVALFVTLSFVTKTQLLGLLLLSLTATVIFLRFKDVTPIIPLLFLVVLCFRDFSVMSGILGYIFLIPAGLALVAKFFIYPIKNFKPGKLFFPLVGVCCALFLSGILSDINNYAHGLIVSITIGPVILIIYTFFSAYIDTPKNFDIKKYLCYVLIILGLTSFAHLGLYRLHMDVLNDHAFQLVHLGWGNINNAATLILLSIGASWYMITQVKNILPYFIILFFLYFGIHLSNSDGVAGICLILTPILAFFAYRRINKYNRPNYLITILIITAGLIIAANILVLYLDVDGLISLFNPDFSDSSRTILYQEALDLFAKYPIFGAGLGCLTVYDPLGVMLSNFHSVLFHVLATMGVVGFIAYVFYLVARFKILTENNSSFSLFMTITFIMFEAYAFIDTVEFNAIPLLSTVTVLLTVVEITNKKSNDQPLPLSHKSYQ